MPGASRLRPPIEFRLKSTLGPEGHRVQIFRIKPKRKRVGLFKGELWLDVQTGMALREDGQFVKVPSIFLKSIRFVRTYEIRDGVSIPTSIESTLETRLMGRVELSVRFHDLTYQSRGRCGLRDQQCFMELRMRTRDNLTLLALSL